MPISQWSIRRYNLSNLNWKELDDHGYVPFGGGLLHMFQFFPETYAKDITDAAVLFGDVGDAVKAWVEERGCKILGSDDSSLLGFVRLSYSFRIAPPGKKAWTRLYSDLSFYYIPPILYAATTNHLPLECSKLFDNCLEPWIVSRGGAVIDEQSLLFEDVFGKFPPDYFTNSTNIKHTKPALQKDIKVHLNTNFERIQTNSETVIVPPGVRITVKRSRTIEHTVDVSWRDLKSGDLNLGIKDVVGVSVLTEVERQRGRSYRKSETIEYEVELSGENVCKYHLVWSDIWCKGIIEIAIDETTQIIPFRFRERSELEVVPLKTV
jgi:hypothetical protein